MYDATFVIAHRVFLRLETQMLLSCPIRVHLSAGTEAELLAKRGDVLPFLHRSFELGVKVELM